MRILLAGAGDDFSGLIAVWNGQQQPAGAVEMRQRHNLFVGGITQYRANAALAQFVHAGTGGFNHHQRNPLRHQLLAEQAADATVANQQRVVTDIYRNLFFIFQRLFQGLFLKRFRFLEVFLQHGEQHRIEHNGENRSRQHQVLPGLRQEIQRHAQTGEDKGKFTNLREAGGDGQRGTLGVAEQTHQAKRGERFTEDDDCQRSQYRQRLLNQNQRIKQHADGDKEQYRKRVT